MRKLTEQQKLEIRCVKEGHAPFVTMCFGYVSCGRCGNQIGDSLAGVYKLGANEWIAGHDCDHCNQARDRILPTLKKADQKIHAALVKKQEAE